VKTGKIRLVTYRTLVDRSGPMSSKPTP